MYLTRMELNTKKMDTIPIVDEIDISISPINITKNSPIAIIATNDA